MEEQKERRTLIRRFNLVFFLIFILFVLLLLRLAFLQLAEGEKYVKAAEELNYRPLFISAPRGWILDRNGEVLVNNKSVYTVTFLEENHTKEDLVEIAEKLEKILMPINPGYNRVKILEKMDAGYRWVPKNKESGAANGESPSPFDPDEWQLVSYSRSSPSYYPRRILEDVPKEVMFYIAEHRNELPGVNVVIEPMRQYKKGAFATHMLGYTRQVPADKVEEYLTKGYRPDDKVGYSGLEAYYEEQLRGKDGIRQVRVNSHAKTVEVKDLVAPKPGNNLILTIDWKFQQKVEKILEEEVHRLRTLPRNPMVNVKSATAVVMNPKTGEIYALANYPQYDLNVWNSPDFNYARDVAGKELNLATQGLYQPGSTIKMLSVMLGLQEGLVTPNEKIYSSGSYRVGNQILKDFRAGGHGWVDARKAIKESVNTYMYEIAMRLADYPRSKTLYKQKFATVDYYFSQFGLGEKTGIDLYPEEKTIWRSPDRQLGRLAHALIGQFHAYTPIQLAQYVSTIANGGYRMKPFIVKEIREPGESIGSPGRTVMVQEPTVLNKVGIEPQYIQLVREAMLSVTQPGGTGYAAFAGFPYKVAAKTGTVQLGGGKHNGLMVGFAPYENPEVAFVVVVPGGESGSGAAGPIARRILDAFYGLDQPVSEAAE